MSLTSACCQMFCEERPEAGAQHRGRSGLSGCQVPFTCRLGPLRLPRHDRGPVPGEGRAHCWARCRDRTGGGGRRLAVCSAAPSDQPAGRRQGVLAVLSHRFLCVAQGQRFPKNPCTSPLASGLGLPPSWHVSPRKYPGPARPSDLGERPPGAERWEVVSQEPKPDSQRKTGRA